MNIRGCERTFQSRNALFLWKAVTMFRVFFLHFIDFVQLMGEVFSLASWMNGMLEKRIFCVTCFPAIEILLEKRSRLCCGPRGQDLDFGPTAAGLG